MDPRIAHLACVNYRFLRSRCAFSATPILQRCALCAIIGLNTGNSTMRVMIVCALLISATLGLGGCFWHHQAAVVSEPAPPLK
jgi:hypothetical protein